MPSALLNFAGVDIACWMFPHDWAAAFSLVPRFPVDVTSGETGRESRSPEDEALRFSARVRIVGHQAEAQALRQAAATLGTIFVGIPVWPDRHTGADWANRRLDPEVIIDLTAAALLAKGAILQADHVYAPLLVGHIDEFGETSALTNDLGETEFTLTEDSPWGFRIGINGEIPTGTWPELLAPDWVSAPIDRATHGLEFEQIGEQRIRTIESQEMPFRWAQDATFSLTTRDEFVALLGFFQASHGQHKAFDMPWWFTPGDPTAEAPASTKVRFATDALEIRFTTDAVASVTIRVVQVPWEILGVEGETPERPARVFLYKITHAVPGAQVWRFTNWPRPLIRSADGQYDPSSLKHQEISEGIDFSVEEIPLDSFVGPNNPLGLLVPFSLEGDLELELYEIETDPVNADAAVLRWSGKIKRGEQTGRRITSIASFLGGLPGRELPNVKATPTCNTNLFESPCGLDPDLFKCIGTLTAAAGCVLTITTAAADDDEWFAHGSIALGAGATYESRSIISSSKIAGGQQIIVDWPLRQAAANQAVEFWPGCDLTKANCQAFGGNWKTRFRGYPNMAQVNLSLPSASSTATGGKK